ncbi:hypothetical protein IW261DRAFT_1513326 [Armillaria novae-zelandiae]|uniref:Uncharacterized protein n=1 Tax=Armillaria novae-zelandiae TaxID=153914 RepID=A0AA39T869_9AGAR|nr:hypothetical protein IW261DRAFT_1513326 [Armillaria novae-zelandiae]
MACDLATIEEYKLRNRVRDLRDNVRKISGNAAQILYSDPCRNFIRDTTIEDVDEILVFLKIARFCHRGFQFHLEFPPPHSLYYLSCLCLLGRSRV